VKRIEMKNFFRHLKEYWIRYLIEIVVITIGILAAVSVEDWNNNRKSRKTELKVLQDLVDGLNGDLGTLEYNKDVHERAKSSCQVILKAFEEKEEYSDSLSRHFAATHYYTVSFSKQGAYESLKSIGLEIVTNKTILTKIVDLYEQWYGIIQVNQEILREEIEHIKLNFNQDHFDQFLIFNPSDDRESFYEGQMTPHDFQGLKQNKQYIYYLKSLFASHSTFLSMINLTIEMVNNIIEELNREIERLV
jgi:hypothetical protein